MIFTNPAYNVYISQLESYARICTSKLDFIHRLRRLSTLLLQQGFKSTLLGKSLAKFFKRHDAIIEKYGINYTTRNEINNPGLRATPYSLLFYILYIILSPSDLASIFNMVHHARAQFFPSFARALLI